MANNVTINCVLVLYSVAMGKGKDKRCLQHTNITTCITKKIECKFPSLEYTYPSTLNLNVKMHTTNTAGMPRVWTVVTKQTMTNMQSEQRTNQVPIAGPRIHAARTAQATMQILALLPQYHCCACLHLSADTITSNTNPVHMSHGAVQASMLVSNVNACQLKQTLGVNALLHFPSPTAALLLSVETDTTATAALSSHCARTVQAAQGTANEH